MSLDSVITWIVIGGIAGLLAEFLVKGVKTGLLGTIIIGILGALIGGWLFGVLHITIATGLLGEIIAAVVGAVILLFILRYMKRL